MSLTVHRVATLASGAELSLYVHEIRGSRPGPTFGIVSGVHGDEFNGPEIVYRFVKELDPSELSGRLLVCPVANPHAYAAISRFTPIDGTNLNRIMPGDADGTLTEMLAQVLTREVLEKVDAYVDVHSGGAYPTVDYTYILNAEDLSRAAGFPVLYRPAEGGFLGTTTRVTVARGVPSVVLEIGGGAVAQEPYVARGVAALKNMLRLKGMLAGTPPPPPRQVVVRRIVTVRPKAGGLLIPAVRELGQTVPKGTLLGTVVSPYTFETLEEIVTEMPESLMILAHLRAHKVEAGDYGYMLGDLATAEPVA
jgi:predicted deacylase